jgi:hypothetical protein
MFYIFNVQEIQNMNHKISYIYINIMKLMSLILFIHL